MTFSELTLCLDMGLIYGVVALGVYLTFRLLDMADLTCDGSFVLGAATSAILLKNGYSPWFALIASIGAGSVAGFLTGSLHLFFKVNPLLAGILVAFALYSLNLKVMGGLPNIALINEQTLFTEQGTVILVGITLVIWFLLSLLLNTDLGLSVRAVGKNRPFAKMMGINVNVVTLSVLMVSNALISLGGALFAQHQGFADVSLGVGSIIIALAAIIIGEKCLPSRSFWVIVAACFVGSFLYRLLVALALHSDWLGLKTEDLNLMTALLVVATLLLAPRKRKKYVTA